MSSYELFVHDPINPAVNSSFQPCSLMNEPNFETGVARSGVKGPLIVGSRVDRSYERDEHLREHDDKGGTYDFHDVIPFRSFIPIKEASSLSIVCRSSDRCSSGGDEIVPHGRGVWER